MKIGIICSPGGHLTEALRILEAFEGHDCFAVIQDFRTVRGMKWPGLWKIYQPKIFFRYSWIAGFPLSFFWYILEVMVILIVERPKILFSTGAEVAIPAFYFAKIFLGTKLIFLESITRIGRTSRTGKAVYPISDLFLVQDPCLAALYGPKARYEGSLL